MSFYHAKNYSLERSIGFLVNTLAQEINQDMDVQLKAQLAGLKDEHARWELRVASLRPESIDKDLLDEEAHALLDRVGKDEVVIFTGAAKTH